MYTHDLIFIEITLKIMAGGSSGFATRTIALPALIGRQSGGTANFPHHNNGIFSNSLMSRKHAEIRMESYGQLVVEDLESSNGTFLNGEQITPRIPYRLNNGDIIQFGSEDEDLDYRQSSSQTIRNGREEALVVQFLLPSESVDNKKAVFSPGRVLQEAKKMLGKSIDMARTANSSLSNMKPSPLSSSFSSQYVGPETEKFREMQLQIRNRKQYLLSRLDLVSTRLSRVQTEIEKEDALRLDYIDDMLNSFDFAFSQYFSEERDSLSPDDTETIHYRFSLRESIRIIVR